MSRRIDYQHSVMVSRLGAEVMAELDAVLCELDDLRPHGNPRQAFFAAPLLNAGAAVVRAGGSVSSAGSPCPTSLAPAPAQTNLQSAPVCGISPGPAVLPCIGLAGAASLLISTL